MPKLIYKNGTLSIYEMPFRHKNKIAKFVRIYERDAAVIVAVKDDGKIILERQFRPAIRRWIYELPAGHLNKRETYSRAAKRELEEETGYSPKRVIRMFVGYPSPAALDHKEGFFIATGLVKGKRNLDPDEMIEIKEVSVSQALKMIKSNLIIDNKSIAGILYYYYVYHKKP